MDVPASGPKRGRNRGESERAAVKTPETAGEAHARPTRDSAMPIMELLFFAYRDFIAEPDAMLAELGFGRAHHRVLHFIGRHPGLRVSELLAILRVTKQSLGRVLRELVERGYVRQQEGATDRRQRLLLLTPAGRQLLERLEAPQVARVRAALEEAGAGAREIFVRVMLGLVDEAERERVAALCGLERNESAGHELATAITENGNGRGAARADRG